MMPTRNVVLTDRHQRVIEKLVRSGRYQNASEVLREGLRLVEQREVQERAKLKALREAARIGFAAVERGDYKDFASFEDLDNYLEEMASVVIAEATRR